MKVLLSAAFLLFVNLLSSQVLIHSHNDYEKPEPLFNALRNKAFAIEADVYLVDGKLMVAHDKKDIRPERSLQAMYIDPLDSLFSKYNGSVSADKRYKPTLVIDIKSDGEKAIATLIAMIAKHHKNFDRRVNPMAVQILISGDRGPVTSWRAYPAFIKFDGRPTEVYDIATLSRVITISESYTRYSKNGNLLTDSLKTMIDVAHEQQKLVRLWGAPDVPATWKLFKKSGIDIINTDKIEECRKIFNY